MRRLVLALALGLCAVAPLGGVRAQGAGKVYRVGFVTPGPAAPAAIEGLAQALSTHGYVKGGNLIVEGGFAQGHPDRLPDLVKEMVGHHVDVIVTTSYPAARAAKEGAPGVPIVVTSAGDPVETGLAESFARPGGNLTGISDMASELSVKRLELLKDAKPGAKKMAMLWNADDLGMTTRYRAAKAVAASLGVVVQPLGVREPDDFDGAFAAMTRDQPDGILMVTDVLTILNRKRVFEFAVAHRIPAIYEADRFTRDGGLMSYGPDGKEVTGRVAYLVDRILQGAKPGDLPFEQPTRFLFAINKKTADAMSLSLPASLLASADEVIE